MVDNQVHTLRTAGLLGLIFVPAISLFLLGTLYSFVEIFNLDVATIVLFILIMVRLAPVSQALQKQGMLITQFSPSFERVRDVVNRAAEQAERLDVGVTIAQLRQEIRFENVTFQYPERTVNALSDVSIEIPARRLTALVGPSGAGKSTFVDLIPRLIDPARGRISIDGVDIESVLLRSLRGLMSYVPQQPFLFDATVSENIRYCRPTASDAEVMEAARSANAHDFIVALPDRYNTQSATRALESEVSAGESQPDRARVSGCVPVRVERTGRRAVPSEHTTVRRRQGEQHDRRCPLRDIGTRDDA